MTLRSPAVGISEGASRVRLKTLEVLRNELEGGDDLER